MMSTHLSALALACSCGAAAALDPLALAVLDPLAIQLAATVAGRSDPDPSFLDMPAQFSAGLRLMQSSALYNQTFTGRIWGSSPTKQQRLSGTQTFVIVATGQVVTQPVTYIEDGSTGIKYTYAPDPKSSDMGSPEVVCTSQRMSEAELSRFGDGPSQFAGTVFLEDRICQAYVDPSVPAPAIAALFLDPFTNVPAAMLTKGPRGINSTIVVYDDLVAATITSAQFAVPHSVVCTPGEVPSLSAWLMW
jgi:hypothetical protein